MGTWFLDVRLGQLTWDDRCYAVFGLEPGSALDYPRFLEPVYPEDRERTDAAVHRAITEFQHYDIEYQMDGLPAMCVGSRRRTSLLGSGRKN